MKNKKPTIELFMVDWKDDFNLADLRKAAKAGRIYQYDPTEVWSDDKVIICSSQELTQSQVDEFYELFDSGEWEGEPREFKGEKIL